MSNKLLKRIIGACSSLLVVVFALLIKVSVTITDGKNTSSPIYKGYFEFLKNNKVYTFAVWMMYIGFVVAIICAVYFITILVLSLLNKDKIVKKLSLITKIMEFVLIGSVFIILIAGFDKEKVGLTDLTSNISLFDVPWLLCLVFGLCPIASRYLIKE